MKKKLTLQLLWGYLIFGILSFLLVAVFSNQMVRHYLLYSHSRQLYDEAILQNMRNGMQTLAEGMARGTLVGTVHEGDEAAVQWFAEALELWLTSRLDDDACKRLLSEPGAEKWREIETKTVVKRWIFGLLEGGIQDVRAIDIDF